MKALLIVTKERFGKSKVLWEIFCEIPLLAL